MFAPNMYQILTTVRMVLIFWKFFVCSEARYLADSNGMIPSLEKVDHAANKTVCPFYVSVNRNESRWPVEIKEIKCMTPMKENCCGHQYECTQLFDKVMVYDKDRRGKPWPELVDVGCVCMKMDSSSALIPDKPPVV